MRGESTNLKKVYFYGICRDTLAMEWFLDILHALEEEDIDKFIDINQYLTGNMQVHQVHNLAYGHSNLKDPITGKFTFLFRVY